MTNEITMPATGMGATIHVGSDSYPYTVENVITTSRGVVVVLQADKAVQAEGYNYYTNQVYVFERDPKGARERYRYDAKRKEWRKVKTDPTTGNYKLVDYSPRLVLGERHSHSDPSF